MSNHKETILLSVSTALLGVVAEAAPTGLLVPHAAEHLLQPGARRRGEDPDEELLLAVPPRQDDAALLAYHRSHRSHRSHSSHYSGSGSSRYYTPGGSTESTYSPPPRRVKPAVVSFVAYPGGKIFVDDKLVGFDSTRLLTLPVGSHTVRIENRFVGDTSVEVNLTEGQTGVIEIKW